MRSARIPSESGIVPLTLLDGVQDLLIYLTLCAGNHALEWRSLRNGQVVGQVCSNNTRQFGSAIQIGAPQPGHPFPVFLVHENGFGNNCGGPFSFKGRVHLIRASTSGMTGLGPVCAGTLDAPPQMGFTDLGAAGVRVHLSNAPPAATAFLMLGLSSATWAGQSLPLALDPFGFPGCGLYTSIDVVAPVTTGVAGNARGYASVDIPIPLNGGLAVTLHGQWLVQGNGPFAPGGLSAALSWVH